MGEECRESGVQPESKQQVHWLEGGERSLPDVHWPRDKFLSSVHQAFMGNQSLGS